MADSFGKLVVRAHAPKRLVRSGSLGLIAALGAAFVVLALSRSAATMRDFAWSIRCAAPCPRARIRSLEAENDSQRRQLEAAEVARRVDREGYRQVERSLGDMQSQIARLNQDLNFYRGPGAAGVAHPRQSAADADRSADRLRPAGTRLKFVLMQTGKPDKEVVGSVSAHARWVALRGKPMSLSFAQASPSRRISLAYSFKYFQDYDEAHRAAAGFRADARGHRHSQRQRRPCTASGRPSSGKRKACRWKPRLMRAKARAGR